MQNSDNILAYMDDYGKVVVSVNRHFYQGKCDYFYISDNENFCHDCVISRIEERADVYIYELSIPCDIEIGKLYYLVENHGVQNVIQYRFIVKSKQFNNEFVPALSIIDVMMFNSVPEIQKMLNEYELL